jgi:hypothetical protein
MVRQEDTAWKTFSRKSPGRNVVNRRGPPHDLPLQGTAMVAQLSSQGPPHARTVTAGFCQNGRHVVFSVIARRRLSSTGGEASPAPTVRQSRPLCGPITDESTTTKVNAM